MRCFCPIILIKVILNINDSCARVVGADDLVVGCAGFGEVEDAVLARSDAVAVAHSRDDVIVLV